jgi:hypothetical protein
MRKLATSILITLATLYYAPTASAMGPSAAVLVGDGFKDGYNLGFGARAGFTLPMSIYVGGTLVYHLGKSDSTPFGDASFRILYLGGEGGYDISAGPLTVRPYLGLGFANATASLAGVSNSQGKAAIWPGAVALFPIGNLFVGADARYVLIIDADDSNAFSLFATLGMTF